MFILYWIGVRSAYSDICLIQSSYTCIKPVWIGVPLIAHALTDNQDEQSVVHQVDVCATSVDTKQINLQTEYTSVSQVYFGKLTNKILPVFAFVNKCSSISLLNNKPGDCIMYKAIK